jgi:hypothetical protein
MSKIVNDQDQNITDLTDYIYNILSGKNKESTIFDLATTYDSINFYIKNNLDDNGKSELQNHLADKYKLDNQKSLSDTIHSITEKAIDKLIKNKYQITIFDIDNAICLLPESLFIKIIDSINNKIEENENVNLILNDRCTAEILKTLVDKSLSVPKDSIVQLMNQKMDDVVYGKIEYLLSLNIEYSKDFAKDLIDDIENNIFKDKENIIANYAKYEYLLVKIGNKLEVNLIDDLKLQISKRDDLEKLKSDILNKRLDDFKKSTKEERDANYIKNILELHHLDIITSSDKDNTLKQQFIKVLGNNDFIGQYKLLNKALETFINKEVTTLHLHDLGINNKYAITIAEALKSNTILKTIYFTNGVLSSIYRDTMPNQIEFDGVIALGKACVGKKITVEFGDNKKNNLFKLIQGTFTETNLNLRYCKIEKNAAIAIAEALKNNTSIQKLDLGNKKIKFDNIQELISRNDINNDVVMALVKACVGKKITVEFGDNKKNNLFTLHKQYKEYGKKEAQDKFSKSTITTFSLFSISTVAFLATTITLSILASQGVIGFSSLAYILPIAITGGAELLTMIGFTSNILINKSLELGKISDHRAYNRYVDEENKSLGDDVSKKIAKAPIFIFNPFKYSTLVEKEGNNDIGKGF